MYLRNRSEVEGFCARARQAGLVGFDTEFVSEKTFRPQLALLQVVTGDEIGLVDPLADPGMELLDDLMCDPKVLKVVHAGKQDMDIFYRRTSQVPSPIFDTQIAAAMVGMGSQISYARLVLDTQEVSLEKTSQFTDWMRRPLTAKQEAYAADDVRYLLPAMDFLFEQLDALARHEACRQEFAEIEKLSRFVLSERDVIAKVKGGKSLKGTAGAVLRELALWREREAEARDLPRRWVLGDDSLVALARARPTTRQGVGEIRGLKPRDLQRSGAALLDCIERGRQAPPVPSPQPTRTPAKPGTDECIALAQTLLTALCRDRRISSTRIATSADLESVVRAHASGDLDQLHIPLLEGWRRDPFGLAVLGLLDGEMSLRIDPSTGAVEVVQSG